MRYRATKHYVEDNGYELSTGRIAYGSIRQEVLVQRTKPATHKRNGDPADPPEYDEEITSESWNAFAEDDDDDDELTMSESDEMHRYLVEKCEAMEANKYDY